MKRPESKTKYSLLYIENDPAVFAQTAKLLSRMGYLLHVAENGQEGLRIFEETKPDLVITELDLPVLGGLEMLRQIRAKDGAVPVVVVTRCMDSEFILSAMEMGVRHYLPKPADPERITAALDACHASVRQEDKLQQGSLLTLALQQGAHGIVLTGPDGTIRFANSRYYSLACCSEAETAGRDIASVEAGDRFSDLFRSISRSISSGSPWRGEIPCRNEGTNRWKQLDLTPVQGPGGSISGFLGIAEDITERRTAEEEARRLNAELEFRIIQRGASLEAAKKELDDFCDAVSHDLRGPISRLQGFSNILIDEYLDRLDDQGKLYAERIGKTCRDLKQIIDALLNLSQISRRAMICQDVDLAAMVQSVAAELQAAAPDRKANISVAPGIVVKGDPGLLKLVVEHLVGNAWKCTSHKKNARIEFGIARNEGKTVYFVRDNGVGFDPKFATKLFKPFQRIHPSEELSGPGLGLAIVQRVVQRHGGRVWAEGETDRGATIYFTLG
ncbi:response regulator [Geobacter sp. DSM 9736]|uniref:sensor histidine kinase n=1 Tax=Geobacter sp. DSM 9736 TaxID=1277350 RepID=UPI000B5065FE|nr:response regulator [Geobacter sp. DSM 9736]SNB46079.1 PAS/PAC sensor hybrid histidine kinase [Geobacter sp. DSM 9736]